MSTPQKNVTCCHSFYYIKKSWKVFCIPWPYATKSHLVIHLVKGHPFCPNFLAHPITREEKFGQTSKLAIYEQKCKLGKRTNRQIILALWEKVYSLFYLHSARNVVSLIIKQVVIDLRAAEATDAAALTRPPSSAVSQVVTFTKFPILMMLCLNATPFWTANSAAWTTAFCDIVSPGYNGDMNMKAL
jgi:hypothetical protein